ncbi:hypothetical protein R3P38DRAFT_3221914 [Favolaschia claudopus]|uniref:Uncharacterized protein n=1 Tax=Favolaschia claudopus TaxID=2862362 RepID=A0AAW0A025_9AGAR
MSRRCLNLPSFANLRQHNTQDVTGFTGTSHEHYRTKSLFPDHRYPSLLLILLGPILAVHVFGLWKVLGS